MAGELATIAADLREGRLVPRTTVRTFMSWFGARGRGKWVVHSIRQQLAAAGLRTDPDFAQTWIDASISFHLVAADQPTAPSTVQEAESVLPSEGDDEPAYVRREATHLVGMLEAANSRVVSTAPDATLGEAITLMLSSDFSQLPVMTSEREVKGVISWKSIGSRAVLGRHGDHVRDYMNTGYSELRAADSLYTAMSRISDDGFVLIRGSDSRVTGIVTASDLSLHFRALTEPFLLLGEIENLLRNLLGGRIGAQDLAALRDPADNTRVVGSIDDLTLGEYVRLLENPSRWSALGLAVDRRVFCEKLGQIRDIRNQVMHFSPDGLESAELDQLRTFRVFLESLDRLLPA